MTAVGRKTSYMPETRTTQTPVTPAEKLAQTIEAAMSETVRRYRTRMAEIEMREMEKKVAAE